MARIFGIIILILSILLFPPATLALISNNAVPGDATYPIKRKLEDGILLIASLHPTTKAWFSVERSSRRFTEVTTLLGQGKVASETIDELVFQTKSAADEVVNISDSGQKDALINQLSESIEKYDRGLAQASGVVIEQTAPLVPPTPDPTPTPPPAGGPTSQPAAPPTIKPSPPAPTVPPTTKKTTPIPTDKPTGDSGMKIKTPEETEKQKQELEEARKKLEEIRKKLEEEKKRLEEERRREKEQKKEEEKKEEESRKESEHKQSENKSREIKIEQPKQEKGDQEKAGKKDD